jgi:hypothetical protein
MAAACNLKLVTPIELREMVVTTTARELLTG